MSINLNEKHLEFIQSAISRMAGNSFLLKGWNATVAAGLFAFSAKDCNSKIAIIALIPGLAFWGLDAYYLRRERLFRRLYDAVRQGRVKESFSMSTEAYECDVRCWFCTLFTPTVFFTHGSILLAILVVIKFLAK